MFESVFIPVGAESVKTLIGTGLARFWVREAFGHLKAIGAVGKGVQLVEAVIKKLKDTRSLVEASRWSIGMVLLLLPS